MDLPVERLELGMDHSFAFYGCRRSYHFGTRDRHDRAEEIIEIASKLYKMRRQYASMHRRRQALYKPQKSRSMASGLPLEGGWAKAGMCTNAVPRADHTRFVPERNGAAAFTGRPMATAPCQIIYGTARHLLTCQRVEAAERLMGGTEPEQSPSARCRNAERINTLVQTLAIIGAGAWGVYTFIYEARIKPSLEPPAVSVATRLEKAGERNNHVAIRSTVTRKNVGQTGVRILGLVYNVIGVRAQFRENAPLLAVGKGGRADRIAAARDYALSEPGTVILHQGMLFAGATEQEAEASDLNPGEELSRDLIVYADRTQYDFVRFEVGLAYTKENDPPVKLRFQVSTEGALMLKPEHDCHAEPEHCKRLKMTDFGTEFSLW